MPERRRLANFYTLVGAPDDVAVRDVIVDRDLQQELSAAFASQYEEFGLERRTHVSFTRDPQYKLDVDDEVFVVKDFSLTLPTLGRGARFSSVTEEEIEGAQVRALVGVPQDPSGRASKLLLFQMIDSRKVLRRSKISILLSDRTFTRNDRSGLHVGEALTAVYRDGDLYFDSEWAVRHFLDMSQLYVEATRPQILKFFRHGRFFVDDPDVLAALTDRGMARKIASIQRRGLLETVEQEKLEAAAPDFSVTVRFRKVGGRRLIELPPVKAELKNLLRLLDQDYLRSPLSEDLFRSNSKLQVERARRAVRAPRR